MLDTGFLTPRGLPLFSMKELAKELLNYLFTHHQNLVKVKSKSRTRRMMAVIERVKTLFNLHDYKPLGVDTAMPDDFGYVGPQKPLRGVDMILNPEGQRQVRAGESGGVVL